MLVRRLKNTMHFKKDLSINYSFAIYVNNFRKIDAKPNVTICPVFLVPLFCGFGEGYGAQHALLSVEESSKKSLDSRGVAGAVPADLSKVFDYLNHELLIAKLDAYGFSRSELQFIYIHDRKLRVKVNGSFSMWEKPPRSTARLSFWGPFYSIYT